MQLFVIKGVRLFALKLLKTQAIIFLNSMKIARQTIQRVSFRYPNNELLCNKCRCD